MECHPECPYNSELMHELHAEIFVQKKQIETIENATLEIKECVLGNGKEGLKIRVDRIEQSFNTWAKVLWVCFGVVLTAAVGTAFAYFGG